MRTFSPKKSIPVAAVCLFFHIYSYFLIHFPVLFLYFSPAGLSNTTEKNGIASKESMKILQDHSRNQDHIRKPPVVMTHQSAQVNGNKKNLRTIIHTKHE